MELCTPVWGMNIPTWCPTHCSQTTPGPGCCRPLSHNSRGFSKDLRGHQKKEKDKEEEEGEKEEEVGENKENTVVA